MDQIIEDIAEEQIALVVNDAGIEFTMPVKAASINVKGEAAVSADFDIGILPAMKVADAQAMLEEKLGQKGPFIEALARKLCHEALAIVKAPEDHEEHAPEGPGGSTGSQQPHNPVLTDTWKGHILREVQSGFTRKGVRLNLSQLRSKSERIFAHCEVGLN